VSWSAEQVLGLASDRWLDERRAKSTEARAAAAAEAHAGATTSEQGGDAAAVEAHADATAVEPRSASTRRREARISAGVDELDRWLQDLVRAGLADAASRPWSAFAHMSARLVDAQAPGLARFVRDLGALPHAASNWPERMLIDIGQLALLLDAWRRLDHLHPDLQAEVRSLVGIAEPRDAVLARPGVHDVWDVLGRRVLQGERVLVQRTWLWGRKTRRWALLLDFSVAGQPIQQVVTPGLSFEAELHFYAGTVAQRALVGTHPRDVGSPVSLPALGVHAALRAYAGMLGRSPWLERAPLALDNVVPRRARDAGWWLGDGVQQVPFDAAAGWQLLAMSGGRPVQVFGEWDGFRLSPLSVASDGELWQVRDLVAA
jgi:hypothetical protein